MTIGAGFRESVQQPAVVSLITRSLRCWRATRDLQGATQPSLFNLLQADDSAILAPVLDSLFSFYEAALQRRVATGTTEGLTGDEMLLLSLVEIPGSCASQLNCPRSAAVGLNCALCSTRIMLSLALGKETVQ